VLNKITVRKNSVYVDVYKATTISKYHMNKWSTETKICQHGYQDIKILLNGTKKGCTDL
jgi:hypothetical protein